MSIEQRKMITDGAMWLFRLSLVIIAWFAVETFRGVQTEIRDSKIETRESIKNVDTKIMEIGRDVNNVEQRVSRIEGKLEQR